MPPKTSVDCSAAAENATWHNTDIGASNAGRVVPDLIIETGDIKSCQAGSLKPRRLHSSAPLPCRCRTSLDQDHALASLRKLVGYWNAASSTSYNDVIIGSSWNRSTHDGRRGRSGCRLCASCRWLRSASGTSCRRCRSTAWECFRSPLSVASLCGTGRETWEDILIFVLIHVGVGVGWGEWEFLCLRPCEKLEAGWGWGASSSTLVVPWPAVLTSVDPSESCGVDIRINSSDGGISGVDVRRNVSAVFPSV